MDGCAEAYRSVERMIWKICWTFSRDRNECDDCLSIANEAFLKAYDSYDPNRGAFTTLVYWCVTNKLRNHYTERKHRLAMEKTNTILECAVEDPAHEIPNRPMRMLESLLADLGDDARLIVQAVIESPNEICKTLKRGTQKQRRNRVWKQMRKDGWTAGQWIEASEELCEAMC